MIAVSPELKFIVASAQDKHGDPLEAKRAEILARQAHNDDEPGDHLPTISEELARLGIDRATKQELREILTRAIDRGR